MTMGDTAFRIGDKVMQTSNNYSKEWYIRGTLRSLSGGVGVFNGDIGVISDIDDIEKTVEILFSTASALPHMITAKWSRLNTPTPLPFTKAKAVNLTPSSYRFLRSKPLSDPKSASTPQSPGPRRN